MIMCEGRPTESPIPRWLRFVLTSDRAGSAWYIGAGFFFAPVLAVLSPWPTITAVLWWIIGLAGLWLGLLGIAMAVGLARVLRSGAEIPEAYWRTLVDYRSANEWETPMSFNPKDAVDAVRDIAANAVEKASDIVENAGHIIRGDIAGGASGIVKDSIDIATHAVDRTKEVFTGKTDDEG